MNYEEMSDFEITKAVASELPIDWYWMDSTVYMDIDHTEAFDPCNNPSDAWPIIVENGIGVHKQHDQSWFSSWTTGEFDCVDKNPLRAAMICFLKMKDKETK